MTIISNVICRPEKDWQYTTSADTSIHLIPPIDKAQDSDPQASSQNVADEEIHPAFPPSFTSLLMNHCPAAKKGIFFFSILSFDIVL